MELLIQLKTNANVDSVRHSLERYGLWTKSFQNSEGHTSLAVLSHSQELNTERIMSLEGVAQVFETKSSHPLVSALAGKPINLDGLKIGGDAPPVLFAGPCSIANRDAIFESAELIAGVGGRVLRGGAFKPRTSPYSFSGHGAKALSWMREAANQFDLKMCTEVMSEHYVSQVAELADIVQVGSRNMQNFALLRALGETGSTIMLKRGLAATIAEWLQAGEHLMNAGAKGIIFCERGILGRDSSTRNLLDLSAVAMLRHVHGLPIIVDPSHALGRRDLIGPMSRASLAAGAHGLMVEAQPADHRALSDAAQSLNPTELIDLARNFDPTPELKTEREVTRL
jgi:3-deoxy-7-phosphoheptulonate synthase